MAALAACGGDDQPAADSPPPDDGFVAGAVDDAVRHRGPTLEQLRDAGFEAVGITSYWEPGLAAPTAEELGVLRGVAARAKGLRIFVAVFHRGSATTPLTEEARAQFAAYAAAVVRDVPELRDVIVGNEPNLNRFWLPQFGPEGENVAAPAYYRLLAATYDAVKAAAPRARVWGGALAPRGIDRPNTGRDTHSPTAFLRALGAAWRATGREDPPLDGLAFHPYPASSRIPPDRPTHPDSTAIGLADYEEKLRPLLDEVFVPGLPVLYSELGVETEVPRGKAALYEGEEPGAPVDEGTQAAFYRRALDLARCQKGVVGMLLFHSHDEPFLTGFQSGVYYVDGTAKASLEPVRAALARTMCG